jgi:HEAT repeat protein
MSENPGGESSGASRFEVTAGGGGARGRRRSRRALNALALGLVGLVGMAASRSLWWGSSPAASAARKLRDGDASTRISAIGELVRFGQEDLGVGIPALRGALKDGEPWVRAAATQALVPVVGSTGQNAAGRAEVRRAVADLFEILRDPVVDVRTAGIGALTMIATVWKGPDGVVDRPGIRDALLDAAADPDAAVRLVAVRGLGVIGPRLADDPAGIAGGA